MSPSSFQKKEMALQGVIKFQCQKGDWKWQILKDILNNLCFMAKLKTNINKYKRIWECFFAQHHLTRPPEGVITSTRVLIIIHYECSKSPHMGSFRALRITPYGVILSAHYHPLRVLEITPYGVIPSAQNHPIWGNSECSLSSVTSARNHPIWGDSEHSEWPHMGWLRVLGITPSERGLSCGSRERSSARQTSADDRSSARQTMSRDECSLTGFGNCSYPQISINK